MKTFTNYVYSGNVSFNRIDVPIAGKSRKTLLHSGLPADGNPHERTPLHKHDMVEVHLIARGAKQVHINGKSFSLFSGSLLAIPANAYHTVDITETPLLQSVFEIDLPLTEAKQIRIPPALTDLYLTELQRAEKNRDFSKICACISLLCSDLLPEKLPPEPESDYQYRIRYFFDNHYFKDVHLHDLAELLHVSEKQAERLVVKHTGNKFRQELTRRRIEVAKHLASTGEMSMNDIAEYVGYQSYSGFWKAWKKCENEIV